MSSQHRAVTGVEVICGASLGADGLAAVRDLCLLAFDGDFDADDLAHARGGLHAVVRRGGVLVAHGALVARNLKCGGRLVRAGYVEALAVSPQCRGEKLGAAVMGTLEELIEERFEMGALSTTSAARGFYRRRGWRAWAGPTWTSRDGRLQRTAEDDDGVLVYAPAIDLDLGAAIVCDWRAGDVW